MTLLNQMFFEIKADFQSDSLLKKAEGFMHAYSVVIAFLFFIGIFVSIFATKNFIDIFGSILVILCLLGILIGLFCFMVLREE